MTHQNEYYFAEDIAARSNEAIPKLISVMITIRVESL